MPDGVNIPGGPAFVGLPQPPDVPCDPTGDGWRGPPGPPGPSGVGVFLPLAGGTMTGALLLRGDPAASLEAASKHYVDQQTAVGTPPGGPFLPLTGGTLTGALSISPPGPMSFLPGVSQQNPIFMSKTSWTGTTARTGQFGYMNWIDIVSDDAFLDDSGASAFRITHNYGGGTQFAGGRVGMSVTMYQVTGATGTFPKDTNQQRIAIQAQVHAAENASGTSSTDPAGVSGSIYSIAGYTRLFGPGSVVDGQGVSHPVSGATNYNDCIGMNMNMRVETGASCYAKEFIHLAQELQDQTQGSVSDACIMIANQPGAIGWKNIMALGRPNGAWPLSLDGTGKVFGTYRGTGLARMQAGYGIDWRDISFNTAAIATPGFVVDGFGNTGISALSLATSGQTTTVDANRIHVLSATVVTSTGTWGPSMGMYDTLGNQWAVGTTDASRNLLTVTLVAPAYITGAPPANPVTVIANSGSAAQATLNLTWSTAPGALSLQPSGGATVFGGPVTLPVIATGGTTARTLADRFGQIIDIRDLGAACDGTTDDTAAWTAAFAKPNGTVIRIPQNCVTIVGDGNFRANGSRAISVIGDGRGSVIRLKSGTALANDMFTWVGGSTRNVRVENLTIDFNNCPQPTALRSIIVLAQVTGAVVRNVAIINGSANLYMVALNGSSDFIVDSCYFQLTIASSAVQNKGIATLSSLAACYRGRIVNNVCINTNTNFTGGNQMYIAGNDISGWGVGAGIATDPNATRNIIIGNKLHDSATAVDVFGINPNGIENWSAQTLIANNECWNCYGDGIATGGANSLIVGNICWDNNTAGIATGGGIAATASGPSFASGSSFMANHCYDSGANTQSYGFVINNAGITNLTLNANRFTGTVADVFHLTTATFLNNTDYVPRILSADPTVALGAATKQYVDGRGAGNHLLYQSSTLVGNGADLTQDVLQTFTVPANTLLNVGDRLIIRASGTFIGSTDSKTAALQWGGGNLLVLNVTTASQQVWRVEAEIMKTGANAQTSSVCFVTNSNTTTATVTTTTRTDTAGIVVNVTGQNATNPVASSITCRYFTVDYVAAA